MDDELNEIFDDIIRKGVERKGWNAWRHPYVDALTNIGDRVWVRHNDPIGRWTYIPSATDHAP